MFLSGLLGNIVFGVAGNAAYDSAKTVIKTVSQKFAQKDLNDLYLDAFDIAAKELKLIIGPNYSSNEPGIDRQYLRSELARHVDLPESNYHDLQDAELLQRLAQYLSRFPIMYIDGEIFLNEDASRLTVLFVERAKQLFRDVIIQNEREFRGAILTTSEKNYETLGYIQDILQIQFGLQMTLLEGISQSVTALEESVSQLLSQGQRIEDTTGSFRQSLSAIEGQSREQTSLLRDIEQALPPKLNKTIAVTLQPDPLPGIPGIYTPRTELVQALCAHLQQITWLAIVGPAGRGKTYLARALVESCDFEFWWISLLYKSGTEALNHLQRHFARVLGHIRNDPNMWLQYVSDRYTLIDLALSITQLADHGVSFIIDNLPDPAKNAALFAELSRISNIFSRSNIKLLTTGQKELPNNVVHSTTPPPLVYNVPPMSVDDVKIMLDRIDAPEAVKSADDVLGLIITASKGHPALINSRLRYWLERDWELREEILTGILTSASVSEVHDDRRDMLLLVSDLPRRLINRLSLLLSEFDRQLALNVAGCDPYIDYAGDHLVELQGTWLEKLEDESFRVTPLLDAIGEENLGSDEQRCVFQTAAEYYLAKGTIDVLRDGISVATYLYQAQSFEQFAGFLAQLAVSAQKREYAEQIIWITSLIPPGSPWPHGMSLDSQIVLRATQVRLQALLAKDVKQFDDDLELLLSQATEANARAVLLACGHAGLFLVETPSNLSPIRIFDRAVKMFRLVQDGVVEFDEQAPPNLAGRIENVIWLATSLLDGLEHVTHFIQTIEEMPPPTRARVFAATLAPMSTAFLIDSVWKKEADKPEGTQIWDMILSAIDEHLANSTISEIEILRSALSRARGVVLADYLNRREEALVELDAQERVASEDSLALILLTRLFILFDSERFDETVTVANRLLRLGGSVVETYAVSISRTLAISYSGLARWKEAEAECARAIQISSQPIFVYEKLELLGESAWISWNQNRYQDVFDKFCELVSGLVKHYDPENPRFREVFSKTGHALGWYIGMASVGAPPASTDSGEEYAPVRTGMFGRSNSRLGQYIPAVGFSKSLLLTQLSMLAQYLGNLDAAWSLYKSAIEAEPPEFYPAVITFDVIRVTPLAAQFGDPEEAISLAIRSNKVISEHRQITVKDAEKNLLYTVFCPVFTYLVIENWGQAEQSNILSKWRAVIDANSAQLQESDLWVEVVGAFEILLTGTSLDFETLLPSYNEMLQPALRSLLSLVKAMEPGTSLQTKYEHQLSVSYHFLVAAEKGLGQALYGLGRYLHSFWVRAVEKHGVILNSPQLLRAKLKDISPNCSGQTVAKTLIAAQQALNIRLPEEISTLLYRHSSDFCS